MTEQLRGPFEKFVDSPHYSLYVFDKCVESYKKCIACQGMYFEIETVTASLQSSDSMFLFVVSFTGILFLVETFGEFYFLKSVMLGPRKCEYITESNRIGSEVRRKLHGLENPLRISEVH
jgi:hypothetical protein